MPLWCPMDFPENRTQDFRNAINLIFGNGGVDFIRPGEDAALQVENFAEARLAQEIHSLGRTLAAAAMGDNFARGIQFVHAARQLDRKSTRLNSSHEWISYAVFCLKKKKKEQ